MNAASKVNENARLELMRLAASLHEIAIGKEDWPEWFPLFECEADEDGGWENDREDIILGMQEATKLGHLENRALHAGDRVDRVIAALRGGREWMVRLTASGYAWIKAHDAIGEAQQEVSRVHP